MKLTLCKRLFLLLLACLACLACTACKTAKEPSSTQTQEISDSLPLTNNETEEILNELPEDELLGKIGAWRGFADSGKLTDREQFSMVTIKSKADLEPYRAYLTNFTEADEKMILEDKAGACVLIELTGTTEHTLYGTSSIAQAGNAITVMISTDETEDTLPMHTFFLLYFPEKYYNGEIIDLAF